MLSDKKLKGSGRGPVDPAVTEEIKKRTPGGELPCAVAFEIVEAMGVSPAVVGEAADRIPCRLVKCQLGLFGYSPEKKIVKPSSTIDPILRERISGALKNGRLPCREAWDIAKALGLPKMAVSAACEAMAIKIKPCQLGAF